jgi:acetyl esterase/lipase
VKYFLASPFTTPSRVLKPGLLLLAFWLQCCAVWAQTKPLVVPLWPKGAPGFENRKNEPEQAQDYWVKNIHNPSITVYLPPKEKATGAAVIICPGGGHRLLVYNSEGVLPAQYLNSIGVAAIVLKYRLSREEGSPYSLDKQPQQDAYRAMRLVRSRAKEWGIDPNRLGMLGFSAGGEVVATVAYADGKGNATAPDPVDRLNGKPDFQMLIYPGPLNIPETVDATAPPAFLLAANNDVCCSEPIVKLLRAYRQAKVPVEVHIYTQGSHGFNMGQRSKLASISSWPQRMADWLADNNILDTNPAHKHQE